MYKERYYIYEIAHDGNILDGLHTDILTEADLRNYFLLLASYVLLKLHNTMGSSIWHYFYSLLRVFFFFAALKQEMSTFIKYIFSYTFKLYHMQF